MTTDTLLDRLGEARRRCNEAREQMGKAITKKAQREAEEELNFWQGKTSWYEEAIKTEATK